MGIKQVFLLLAALAAAVFLLIFAQTQPPQKQPAPEVAQQPMEEKAIEASALVEQARARLPEGPLGEINQKELAIKRARDNEQRAALLADLAKSWEQYGHPVLAGHYYEEASGQHFNQSWLEHAAELYFFGFSYATDTLTRQFGAQRAAAVYEQLYAADSSRRDYRIRQALSYIDGMNNVMQGVILLRQVEAADPDNEQVNLILGRLGVVSGQFDKAIARLEKVTRNNPGNAEAFFHLANAYQATGRLDEAIAAYEKVRLLMDDPEFDAQLSQLIDQIKKR